MPATPRPVPEAVLANQHAIVRRLLAALRPHWRRDRALPLRLEALLRGDRRFGSRDRRLYRELTYTALRILPWIESLPDDAWTRTGNANGNPMSVRALAYVTAGHPRHHQRILRERYGVE